MKKKKQKKIKKLHRKDKKLDQKTKLDEKTKIEDQHIRNHIIDSLKKLGLSPDEVEYIHGPEKGEVKMSEVILKIAEPYIKKYWNNYKRIFTIISLTVTVWNFTLLPEDNWDFYYDMLIDHLPKDLSGESVASFMEFIDTLIDRKKEYFPDIQRFIMHFDLSIHGRDITLNIISVPLTPKIKEKD